MSARAAFAALAALVLAACGGGEDDVWLGYVEGDFLRLGPREAGTVTVLNVREGETVAAGMALFAIDAERARFAVDEARARLEAAEARTQDLMAGGRPEEVAAAQDQLSAARADLDLAQTSFARSRDLLAADAIAEAELDEDRRALESARARVAELENRAALTAQPARADQIAAARREADAARAALSVAEEALADRGVAAPKPGRIDRIYLREGEYAAPGAPVLSLLPPDNLKVVFFAPETRLAELSPGTTIALSCDSCPSGLTGEISRIADRAEFAPPVIYSEDARAKLVYRVEALLAADTGLKPGQPVEARPAP